MGKDVKLSPPWNTFVSELKALFGEDKDIRIEYDDASYTVKLFVEDAEKADALTQLIPNQRIYGNVALNIQVIPANKNSDDAGELFAKVFKGNPVLSDLLTVPTPYGNMCYAVFRKEVVQFFNDELGDPHGNMSTLYEDIARDVFGDSALFFCTDVE